MYRDDCEQDSQNPSRRASSVMSYCAVAAGEPQAQAPTGKMCYVLSGAVGMDTVGGSLPCQTRSCAHAKLGTGQGPESL